MSFVGLVRGANALELSQRDMMPLNPILIVEIFDV
jgi:hypothetical protein